MSSPPATAQFARSRTGCWTCRFRKKKCDETTPVCNGCSQLRLVCDNGYEEQPLYMRDAEAAKEKKKAIKQQMGKCKRKRKRKTPEEKVKAKLEVESGSSCSNSSKLGSAVSGGLRRTRSIGPDQMLSVSPRGDEVAPSSFDASTANSSFASESTLDVIPESDCSGDGKTKFVAPPTDVILLPPKTARSDGESVDGRTPRARAKTKIAKKRERHNDVDMHLLAQMADQGPVQDPSLSDSYLISAVPLASSRQLRLLKHYVEDVCDYTYRGMYSYRDIFKNIQRAAMIPRCAAYPTFLNCALSSGALHLLFLAKRSNRETSFLEREVAYYQALTFRGLHEAFAAGDKYEDILGTIVVLMNFEINTKATLQSWGFHLNAAIECIRKLDPFHQEKLNVGLGFLTRRIVWLDIMSACTLGTTPKLNSNYQEMLARGSRGVSALRVYEVAGCHDEVLYLLSEVLHLDEFRTRSMEKDGGNWETAKTWAVQLGHRLELALVKFGRTTNAITPMTPVSEHSSSFAAGEEVAEDITPTSTVITTTFLVASRIHLHSLVNGFYPRLDQFQELLEMMMEAVAKFPTTHGRSIVWPLLVGSCLAVTPDQREFFRKRFRTEEEPCGVLTIVGDITEEVWRRRDELEESFGVGGAKEVHWRFVMRDLGLEILLA